MGRDVYVELVLRGSQEHAEGFVEGLRLATPEVESVWFCHREMVAQKGLVESLKERLHLNTHIVLPRTLATLVAEALSETTVVELELESMRELDYAELDFDYVCYDREVGRQLRAVIEEHLPAGVRIEGYEVHEDVDEGARGVELYTPAHEYTLRGKGRYAGPIPAIFDLSHRLDDQDFIHPGRINLHHAS